MSDTEAKLLFVNIIFFVLVFQALQADEMVHEFKSPSFSGVGTSSHYLTIDSQETSRRDAIQAKIEALQDKKTRAETVP